MTDADYDALVKAMKATVKRIAVENTWLRHSLMEMEARITAMATQLGRLETRAKTLRQALRACAPPTASSKPSPPIQTKEAAAVAQPKPPSILRKKP